MDYDYTDPQSAVVLTGTIAAGGFYIVCNNADKFSIHITMIAVKILVPGPTL